MLIAGFMSVIRIYPMQVDVTVLSTTGVQTVRKSRYTYSATVKRNPANGIYTVLAPLIIISLFSIFSYIVPTEGGARYEIKRADIYY